MRPGGPQGVDLDGDTGRRSGMFHDAPAVGLGGPVTYIVIRGTSMLPTYQPGDLVLVGEAEEYGPGDVVAYQVPEGEIGEGMILIHRIVGGSAGEGFVLLGDNNDEEDVLFPKNQRSSAVPWPSFLRSAWCLPPFEARCCWPVSAPEWRSPSSWRPSSRISPNPDGSEADTFVATANEAQPHPTPRGPPGLTDRNLNWRPIPSPG